MSIEDELKEIRTKIDEYHRDDTKRAKREQYRNQMYIL